MRPAFAARFIQCLILVGIFHGALACLPSSAFAQVSAQEALDIEACFDDVKKDSAGASVYLESSRSLEEFEKMSPTCQKYVMGSLLGQGYLYQEREGVDIEDTIPERDLIIKKYLDHASEDLKREVYMSAVVELIETVTPLSTNAAQTAELFQKLLNEEPAKGPQTICRVLWDMGTLSRSAGSDDIHPELLGKENARLDRLRPLLALRPGLVNQSCDFSDGNTGQNKVYPIGYLLGLAASEAAKLKQIEAATKNGDTTKWVQKYSACTEDQLVSIFHHNLQIFNPGKGPYQLYLIETQGACSVQGILRIVTNKSKPTGKPSYLFFPSSQTRFQEAGVKPLAFVDVFEIARILKRDPRTYILTKSSPISEPTAPQASVLPAPAPKPPTDEKISLQGAYESVIQFFRSSAEAVTGSRR